MNLFILAEVVIAALMLLAADYLAKFLVEHQLDTLLLLLLTLLLVGVFFLSRRGVEDLRLHLEQLVQRDAILGILRLDFFRRLFLDLDRLSPVSAEIFSRYGLSRHLLGGALLSSNRGFGHRLCGSFGEYHDIELFVDILDGLGADAGQAKHLVLIQLQRHHQVADGLIAGLDQDVEDMLLQAKRFQRHGKGRQQALLRGPQPGALRPRAPPLP